MGLRSSWLIQPSVHIQHRSRNVFFTELQQLQSFEQMHRLRTSGLQTVANRNFTCPHLLIFIEIDSIHDFDRLVVSRQRSAVGVIAIHQWRLCSSITLIPLRGWHCALNTRAFMTSRIYYIHIWIWFFTCINFSWEIIFFEVAIIFLSN